MANAGFTLIEVVVAIGILAVIMTIVYGAFSRSMDVTRETAEVTDRVRQVQVITERLIDELSAAYWFPVAANAKARGRFVGTKDTASSDDARLDRLEWTTFAHRRYVGDQPESDVAEVAYRVEPAPGANGGRLVRDERINLLAEGAWASHTDELADGVSEFRLRYLHDGDWVDAWDAASAQPNGLPDAVEVTVALAGSGSAPAERVRTIVPLPLAGP